MRTRVMPVLLLDDGGLVKTTKFKNPVYIGDPINTIRIFNEKEVDEIVFLDIAATKNGSEPDFDLLSAIAGEAFMPMAYGGGVKTLSHAREIFSIGFEKIILNSVIYDNPEIVREIAGIYGSQSVVGCVDVKRNVFGKYDLFSDAGAKKRKVGLIDHLARLREIGVGEIVVNSIDKDGTLTGYDLKLLEQINKVVSVPIVPCGGASCVADFAAAIEKGASAVSAGAMFVFKGKHRAVLISYPDRSDLEKILP
ncbi:imidazole glycerol phosphate synthase [Thalassospira profundimaris]|nr:imidazole glycerol phosphate synthase [Thalassospira profundimaris]